MKVDAANRALLLVEADVIEALEASARDGADAVVWHEEVFLPSHKNVLAFCIVLVIEVGLASLTRQRLPGREAVPVLHVDLVVGAPVGPARLKGVFGANDFALKVCCQGRVILCEAWISVSRNDQVPSRRLSDKP